MATSTGQKWLIGCSLGCGAIVLVVAVLATGTCFVVKDVVDEISKVAESQDALIAAFGKPEEFTPTADGSIGSERIETFLVIRGELGESRDKLHAIFDNFPPEEGSGFWTFFKVVGGLAGMIDDIVAFIDSRNQVLLEHDMGYGEYLYIYSMAYYAWLEHDPGDGPMHEGERILDGDDSSFGVERTYRGYREMMLAFLRNQLDAIPSEADGDWRSQLQSEIDELKRGRRRVAWRGNLPPALAASLEPYRAALEATYDAETNCFELPGNERDAQGGLRWEID